MPPPDRSAAASGCAPRAGVVAIGRNEGERLRRCLASLDGPHRVVYVDSGSTDGSQDAAREAGAVVVELDLSQPFTAARARNLGCAALTETWPELEFVQFVDGDCELASGWLDVAIARLGSDPGLAVVCGRRREIAPEASVYNRLLDQEWDTPIGPALACGGDALMRLAAFREVGGFDPGLIAGEEPELCLRLRRAGWRIERIDAEMTRHDAALTRFGQWWRRAVRAGYASAEGVAMYRSGYPRLRGAISAVFWSAGAPVAALCAVGFALLTAPGLAWLPVAALLAAYGLMLVRIARGRGDRGPGWRYSLFCLIGKAAETQGIATYFWRRVTGAERRLIEYKS